MVEAYSDSWGPCGSVGTLLKKFLTEASPPEGGLEVLVCKAEGNALLDKYTQQSTPHFLFYRNGALLETIAGPNVPALEAALRAARAGPLQGLLELLDKVPASDLLLAPPVGVAAVAAAAVACATGAAPAGIYDIDGINRIAV